MFKFIWNWQLLKRKQKALYETEQDLLYFRTMKGSYLNTDEEEVRDQLFEENKKDPRDEKLIKDLTKKLSEIKSVKANYEQTLELRDGLVKYIEMLKK